MVILTLRGTRTVHSKEKSHLIIHYYLVESVYRRRPIYGIQIQSHSIDNPNFIHSETIQHISYSSSYVDCLIKRCMDLSVAPTDLFYSLDILMDTLME